MTGDSVPPIASIITLALEGLEPLYDHGRRLFAYKIDHQRRVSMPMVDTINYTAACVLGLSRAHEHGWPVPTVHLGETVRSLVGLLDHVAARGELGLVLWADARCEGAYRGTLLNALVHQLGARRLDSMPTTQLAWLLTGLCYSHRRADPDALAESLAMKLHAAVAANFVPDTGLFRHSRVGGGASRFRSQIGNFADQIYAVYALASFYQEFGVEAALQQALHCAATLCALQGGQGQWWWHYHAPRGVVASRYPVFAVHQHGMAPMALHRLAEVSGVELTTAVSRGFNWLFGANELRQDMVDWDRHVVWRGVQKAFPARHLRFVTMGLVDRGLLGPAGLLDSIPLYRQMREMRPYELGWLLYAFVSQSQPDVRASLGNDPTLKKWM